MADYRRIMTLLLEECSYREVVETAGCSHREVSRARQAIRDHGVVSIEDVGESELAAWFPDGRRRVSAEYEQPDLTRATLS